jgi:hypothetical protein
MSEHLRTLGWLALALICACAAAIAVWELSAFMPRGFTFLHY